jgi:RNA polymerase sigma-70 factor (ECF subfamily)
MTTSPADRARFDALWNEHHPAVFAYAARRVGREDAADVAAETFLVAWRRRAEIPAREAAWLLGIARKQLGNRRRTHQRRERLVDRLGPVTPQATDPLLRDGPPVIEALGRLPESDREALLLVNWEGLTNKEAAIAMGTTVAGFNVRIHRARARLRRELAALERSIESGAAAAAATGGG